MPHQCTGCGHTFEDGSKEMLSGCPDCGGNKFQFRPASAVSDDSTSESRGSSPDAPTDAPVDDPAGGPGGARASSQPESGASPPDDSEQDTSSVAETVGRATTRVRDFVSSGPEPAATEGAETADPNPAAEWPDDWDTKSSKSDRSPHDGSDSVETDADEPHRDGEIIDADAHREAERTDDRGEDVAQRSARSDVVSPDEINEHSAGGADRSPPKSDLDQPSPGGPNQSSPGGSGPTPDNRDTDGADASDAPQNGEVVGEPTGEDPDLADLREQLNDQFESIKILEPGQYELNLMELYDREEYIIALQENGRYVIQVPEQWIGEDMDDR